MTEEQIKQVSQELSEEDLNDLAAGKLNPKTEKVLKYVGIGLGSAAVLAGAGVGIAAVVGWKTGKGTFGYLHSDPTVGKNIGEYTFTTDPESTVYHQQIEKMKKGKEEQKYATIASDNLGINDGMDGF